MGIVQMSCSGAVLILAVVVLRALTMNRLPKDTFLILWGIVLVRLLVPFSVPSGLSVYSWIEQNIDWELPAEGDVAALDTVIFDKDGIGTKTYGKKTDIDTSSPNTAVSNVAIADNKSLDMGTGMDTEDVNSTVQNRTTKNDNRVTNKTVCSIIWCVGMLACMAYFAVSYLRCRFEFQISFPVECPYVEHWVKKHRHRLVTVRQSDKISTPLTYGIFHPVILMPKNTDWENTQQLQYILMHEYIHICRGDTLTKLFCTCALCVHWFNPMVWIMYVLFNRDVEISCDEHVVRRFGEDAKSVYARMLIQMEAQRSNLMGYLPFGNGFLLKIGDSAMQERITAIMKIKKKSLPVAVLAAALVISVTAVFATSAAGKTENPKTGKEIQKNTELTKEERQKLLALQLEGYEAMRISDYQENVWKLIDNEEYRDLLERISQDETLYAVYEGKRAADKKTIELITFFYNIFEPLTAEKWQTRDFSGSAASGFSSASDNAILEYTVTLTIQDADQLTIEEYDTVRRYVTDDLKQIFQTHKWMPTELRDEELMQTLLDEEIDCIKREWESERLAIGITYHYTPLGELSIDEMQEWQPELFADWDSMYAPYVPFGLTYKYDQSIDECRMYFQGKEVRAIYDTVQNLFLSAHLGVGEGIYATDAIDLYVEYDDGHITGLREATPEEMEEATERRRAVTESYRNGQEYTFDRLREDVPATEEDYQSLLALKTPDYRSKTIAAFNEEMLDWTNNNFDRKERISVDNFYEDYRVMLTEEEKTFAAITAHFSGMENAAYVRSIQKKEPVCDVVENVSLHSRQEFGQESNRAAWCSLYYTFSYHISDKEKVRVGTRDDCVGGMMDSIRGFWESSTVDQLVRMTEEQMLETLHAIAEKYSSRDVTITILDDQVAFETMDERMLYASEREDTAEQAGLQDIDTITINGKKYYMIATESQLRSIGEYGLDKNYMQQNDIEISNEAWIPIGTSDNPFTGSYNGNGFKIVGFSDRHSDNTLFGNASSADLYNITFSDRNAGNIRNKKIVCKKENGCRIYDIFFE